MTVLNPHFGIDLSYNNDGVSIQRAWQQDYEFGILRVTGGFDARRDVLVDWKYPEFQKAIHNTGMIQGVYGFPLSPHYISMDRQVDVYLNSIRGSLDKKIIAVDYERYGPMPEASCTIAGLREYIRLITKLTGGHQILLYAGKSWWTEAPHSGQLSDYGDNVTLWNPWYWTMSTIQHPKRYYFKHRRGSGYWERYAGTRPKMAQYCIGKVDGQPVDINAWRLSMRKLQLLTI